MSKKKQKKQRKWLRHEALDRTSVIMRTFEAAIADHPAILHDQEFHDLATTVGDALEDLYTAIARKHFKTRNKGLQ